MRMIQMTAAVMFGLAALGAGASDARAQEYPWCAVDTGEEASGAETCTFISFQQCMLTATPGSGQTCARNPFYNARDEARPPRRTRR